VSYGEPSKGLMQTVPSTFDPLENLKASAVYATEMYGSARQAGKATALKEAMKKFAEGGVIPYDEGGRMPSVMRGEYILTPDEASRISREILGRWAEPEEDVFDSYPEPPPPPVF
jgi:hypothetical protein